MRCPQEIQGDAEQKPILANYDSVKCGMIRSVWSQSSWSAIVSYVIITCSIVAVATIQILQGVNALQNPTTTTSFQGIPRVFPGILICPLVSADLSIESGDTWSRNAYVSLSSNNSFIIEAYKDGDKSDLKAPVKQSAYVLNTNADKTRSDCSNSVTDCRQYEGKNVSRFIECMRRKSTLGAPSYGWLFGISSKDVLVRNSAFENTCSGIGPCGSVYPPQVGCLAMDHTMFPALFPNLATSDEYSAAAMYFKDLRQTESRCNPMLEGSSSDSGSSLSLNLNFRILRFSSFNKDKFEFNGIFESLNVPLQYRFPGLVALFYNPSEGIPKSLKFDETLFYGQNPVVNGFPSAKLSSWREAADQPPTCRAKSWTSSCRNFTLADPLTSIVDCSVSNVFATLYEKIFSDNKPSVVSLNYTMSVVGIPKAPSKPVHVLKPLCGCDDEPYVFPIAMKFSRSSTLVLSETISTSLLTTLSLVVSTAATILACRGFLETTINAVYSKFEKLKVIKTATIR
jgi:hypothetical protein